MYCFDQSDIYIFNDYNSLVSGSLSIKFDSLKEFCRDANNTSPGDCIEEWDYRQKMIGKSIVLLQNQHRFQQDLYGDSPIIKESVLNWIPFPSIDIVEIMSISELKIEREDNVFMAIESVTEENDKGFQIKQSNTVYSTQNAKKRLELNFFMNRDVIIVKR